MRYTLSFLILCVTLFSCQPIPDQAWAEEMYSNDKSTIDEFESFLLNEFNTFNPGENIDSLSFYEQENALKVIYSRQGIFERNLYEYLENHDKIKSWNFHFITSSNPNAIQGIGNENLSNYASPKNTNTSTIDGIIKDNRNIGWGLYQIDDNKYIEGIKINAALTGTSDDTIQYNIVLHYQ